MLPSLQKKQFYEYSGMNLSHAVLILTRFRFQHWRYSSGKNLWWLLGRRGWREIRILMRPLLKEIPADWFPDLHHQVAEISKSSFKGQAWQSTEVEFAPLIQLPRV